MAPVIPMAPCSCLEILVFQERVLIKWRVVFEHEVYGSSELMNENAHRARFGVLALKPLLILLAAFIVSQVQRCRFRESPFEVWIANLSSASPGGFPRRSRIPHPCRVPEPGHGQSRNAEVTLPRFSGHGVGASGFRVGSP